MKLHIILRAEFQQNLV